MEITWFLLYFALQGGLTLVLQRHYRIQLRWPLLVVAVSGFIPFICVYLTRRAAQEQHDARPDQ